MKGTLPLKIASLEVELEIIKSELEGYKKKKGVKSFKDLQGLWKGKDFSLAEIKSIELKPSFDK